MIGFGMLRDLDRARERLNAHRPQEVKAYLAAHREIIVAWPPAYAPDLNPEAGGHGS